VKHQVTGLGNEAGGANTSGRGPTRGKKLIIYNRGRGGVA
jgi:hypothetical protein